MKSKANLLATFLFAVLHFQLGFAQPGTCYFKHLTVSDGLSQNSINCIHQDKYGFMWFGTQDGLNRYDGYKFIQYRNVRNNKNSISNNYIWDIHEDENGILWIATFGGGLNKLNPLTGQINCFTIKPNDSTSFPSKRLFSIVESPKGILWIGSNEGLIRFDISTTKSKIFLARKNQDNSLADNYVGIVTADQVGNIWLTCDSGLTRFNTISFAAEYFQQSPFSNTIELGHVTDIINIGDILLITCNAGLLEINIKFKTDKLLFPTSAIQTAEHTPVFQRVMPFSNHQYAIGTNKGLLLIDEAANIISLAQNDVSDEKSISHNNILSLLKSNDGILWIGTRNGLNKFENGNPDFIHIRSIAGKNGLSSKNVNSFIEENDSLLWIGTPDGLNLYNKKSNTSKVFHVDEKVKKIFTSNYILCMSEDSKGNKWIGTRDGGFYKIQSKPGSDQNDTKIQYIRPSNDTLSAVSVHYITEGRDGYLWIGTGGAGLWKYDPVNNTVKKYGTAKDGRGPNHPFVFNILQDSYDNIWIGTPTGGLNLFNPKTEKFIYFRNNPDNENSISNDIVLSQHEDKQNNLWIGTSSGLNKLIPKLDKNIFEKLSSGKSDSLFKNFGYGQGFLNNVIYGMLEDDYRRLWISTNKGLALFDMNEEKVVKTFDVSDGLQSAEFNQNGYYKSERGLFYFGGVAGFNIFHPDSVKGNQFVPPVMITGMYLFNEPVKIGNDTSGAKYFLEKELYGLNEISLSWQQDVVTFEFAALSFVSPEKNQYSYILEGFDKDWISARNTRTATYTNLDPGNYIFKVRACNNNGVWNEKGTFLKIVICTPPWLSWYAYLVYFLIVGGVVWLFMRYRINKATELIKVKTQIEKARIEEREEFRKKSAADFHDEAGNKITKLTLFAEMARSEINDKAQLENYLKKIQVNIAELSTGMRDFLWVMDSQRDTLFETLTRIKDFGESILTETGIHFKASGMNAAFQNILLPMNKRRAVLQIFKEAINNCAKHAAASEVTLRATVNNNIVEIVLEDNGKGFDTKEERNRSKYGLNIMHERAKKNNSELEIFSKKNKGTTIILKFQIP